MSRVLKEASELRKSEPKPQAAKDRCRDQHLCPAPLRLDRYSRARIRTLEVCHDALRKIRESSKSGSFIYSQSDLSEGYHNFTQCSCPRRLDCFHALNCQ